MPRAKGIPTKPRFDLINKRAFELLIELGFSSLPISPWDIIREYEDTIKCIPLSEANDVLQKEGLNKLFRKRGDEGITVKFRGDSFYVIIYDDINIDNQDRILWTIMHELGHIFMRHLGDFDLCNIHRGGLSEKEYGVLEVEAHQFAAEMFAPTPVMLRFDGISEDQLRVMCGLSADAAGRRYTSLFEKPYHPQTKYDAKLVRNFSSFLRWGAPEAIYEGTQKIVGQGNYIKYLALSRKCPNCFSFTTDPKAKFCIYCGREFEEPKWDWDRLYGRDSDDLRYHPPMKRFTYEIDKIGYDWNHDKYLKCPVCQNEEVSPYAEFCHICGQPLRNVCKAEGKAVTVRARYCPDCGSETTFKKSYERHENTMGKLMDLPISEDWLEYDYWDYIIGQVHNNHELWAALNCARAFTDDDDNVHIVIGEQRLAQFVIKNKSAIQLLMRRADGVKYKKVEVYCI